jgi:hypothetical protein
MKSRFVIPDWMRPYEQYFNNTGGNTVEELLGGESVSIQRNAPLALIQMAAEAQAGLLIALHRKGLLVAPSPEKGETG